MPELTADGSADVHYGIDKAYSEAGTYTVKILFTYDRHGSQTHNDEVLSNSTLTLNLANWVRIETDDRKDGNRFIERGEENGQTEIPIVYTISDNEEREVKALKLEGDDSTEYFVEKVPDEENQYKVTFKVPTKSGKHTFKVNQVVYDQLTVDIKPSYETTVEILRPES